MNTVAAKTLVPQEYKVLPPEVLKAKIAQKKREWGKKLVILMHHYQRKEIVPFGDHLGDSFGLSQKAAAEKEAEHIVFCGVHFMAESADILARQEQHVYLPNPYAGCPMADMAQIEDVFFAWDEISRLVPTEEITPISYMNSAAVLKAFCGKNGGIICTSSNVTKAFNWGLSQRPKIFFFPDENLGLNAARMLNYDPNDIIVWDFKKELGGNTPEQIKNARLILWKGYCHVHTNFRPEHIVEMRTKYPGIKIVVHPECIPEVVEKADAAGSTTFIVKYIKEQPAGSVIAIGTELNLVSRLADEHPDKKILDLSGQTCPICVNMFRTTLADLAFTLDHLGEVNEIIVEEEIKKDALVALTRMLEHLN